MTIDILYVQVQEYLNLRQEHMIVKKFYTRLNALSRHVPSIANNDKGKMKIFINRLRSNNAKDMLIGNNLSKIIFRCVR